ncbi:MAG: dTMP kinase [Deltaproteobacteria bacterium]|nr:dTMP kinase [Deltaproteobacteria bacterium]
MFVVFEGIDGGGKTTLSNLVATLLRERGRAVEHVREGGKFASRVTQAMRELGRDARNLAMTPRAELMMYLTREIQLLEEATRPALARADVVIADRYVYTAQALAVYGRGMAAADVEPVVAAAAGGLIPELVVLVDVDPHVARARRRVSKLLAPDDQAPSRKGLAGTALQLRLRDGYRALAAREPARWIVVDNTEAELHAVAHALADAIDQARQHRAAPALAIPAPPPALRATDLASARAALVAWCDRRAPREPALAAYVLEGLAGEAFAARRRELATRAPVGVAAGLRWLDDDDSWQLRRGLLAAAPAQIALSLASPAGLRVDGTELLHALLPVAPREVAAALHGRDDADAWALRDAMPLALVIRALGGVPGPRAWALREQWLGAHGGLAHVADVATATVACEAVDGIADDLAWSWRKGLRELAPVAALASLVGVDDERAWKWRARYVERAPKVVMRTLGQSIDTRAWALRARVADHCEETFDSLLGLDTAEAWHLREAGLARWPWAVVKSLGAQIATARGRALVAEAFARAPTSLALWRQALLTDQRWAAR